MDEMVWEEVSAVSNGTRRFFGPQVPGVNHAGRQHHLHQQLRLPSGPRDANKARTPDRPQERNEDHFHQAVRKFEQDRADGS